jgi:hypothetical protein
VVKIKKLWAGAVLAVMVVTLGAGPALACGGLVAPNGSVNLLRTATLAAYHDGIEHYVTSFEFAGGGEEVGSIVPLPGIPSAVKRGGRWTLQRLQQEVAPPVLDEAGAADSVVFANAERAVVLFKTKIEALDITVLKGGGDEVGVWAKENGFALPPDAPEVLDFYASRSPIFMAAKFDIARAKKRGQVSGDGTPIHVTIPTPNPWVPLRILALGRQPDEIIEADVFLLTDAKPVLLPAPGRDGFELGFDETASDLLLDDLGSDKGMGWLPREDMHLSYIKIDSRADQLQHDLAIDPTGTTMPSFVAAGLSSPVPSTDGGTVPWAGIFAGLLVIGGFVLYAGRQPIGRPIA